MASVKTAKDAWQNFRTNIVPGDTGTAAVSLARKEMKERGYTDEALDANKGDVVFMNKVVNAACDGLDAALAYCVAMKIVFITPKQRYRPADVRERVVPKLVHLRDKKDEAAQTAYRQFLVYLFVRANYRYFAKADERAMDRLIGPKAFLYDENTKKAAGATTPRQPSAGAEEPERKGTPTPAAPRPVPEKKKEKKKESSSSSSEVSSSSSEEEEEEEEEVSPPAPAPAPKPAKSTPQPVPEKAGASRDVAAFAPKVAKLVDEMRVRAYQVTDVAIEGYLHVHTRLSAVLHIIATHFEADQYPSKAARAANMGNLFGNANLPGVPFLFSFTGSVGGGVSVLVDVLLDYCDTVGIDYGKFNGDVIPALAYVVAQYRNATEGTLHKPVFDMATCAIGDPYFARRPALPSPAPTSAPPEESDGDEDIDATQRPPDRPRPAPKPRVADTTPKPVPEPVRKVIIMEDSDEPRERELPGSGGEEEEVEMVVEGEEVADQSPPALMQRAVTTAGELKRLVDALRPAVTLARDNAAFLANARGDTAAGDIAGLAANLRGTDTFLHSAQRFLGRWLDLAGARLPGGVGDAHGFVDVVAAAGAAAGGQLFDPALQAAERARMAEQAREQEERRAQAEAKAAELAALQKATAERAARRAEEHQRAEEQRLEKAAQLTAAEERLTQARAAVAAAQEELRTMAGRRTTAEAAITSAEQRVKRAVDAAGQEQPEGMSSQDIDAMAEQQTKELGAARKAVRDAKAALTTLNEEDARLGLAMKPLTEEVAAAQEVVDSLSGALKEIVAAGKKRKAEWAIEDEKAKNQAARLGAALLAVSFCAVCNTERATARAVVAGATLEQAAAMEAAPHHYVTCAAASCQTAIRRRVLGADN